MPLRIELLEKNTGKTCFKNSPVGDLSLSVQKSSLEGCAPERVCSRTGGRSGPWEGTLALELGFRSGKGQRAL